MLKAVLIWQQLLFCLLGKAMCGLAYIKEIEALLPLYSDYLSNIMNTLGIDSLV